MAPHPPSLRRLAVIAVSVLAWTTLGIAVAPAAHAAGGLAVSGRGRFVVDPAGSVSATQTITVTNQKPDTANSYFYWHSFAFTIPNSASGVRVTSRGSTLSTSTESSPNVGEHVVTAEFPSDLRYGQSRTLELTYVLDQAQFRTEDAARVGKGFATFPVIVPGDPGELTVEVVAPSYLTFSTSDPSAFTSSADGNNTVRTVTEPNQDDYFVGMVAFMADDVGERRTVEAVGRSIDVIGFPGDTAWADFAGANLPKALASLAKTTGQPAPRNLKEVREDISLRTRGWEGQYNSSAQAIRLSEDLNLDTFCHELAHTWLDGYSGTQRWLSEGLAADLAMKTVQDLTGSSAKPGNFRPVTRSEGGAIALDTWEPGDNATAVEEYAYPASLVTVGELTSKLSPEVYAKVVGAVVSRKIPLDGSSTYSATNVTWKEFLDALETVDTSLVPDAEGRTAATGTITTWVLSDAGVDWKARADARAHYARVNSADGPWTPPALLRQDLGTWDFSGAQSVMATLDPLAAQVTEVQRIAQQSGRSASGVQVAYETAGGSDTIAALPRTLTQATTALTTLADADRASADTPLPTAPWARSVLAVPAWTADAEKALGDGRMEAAATSAGVALERAKSVGLLAAAMIAGPLLLLVGIGLGARALRRRAKVRAANAAAAAAAANAAAEAARAADEAAAQPWPGLMAEFQAEAAGTEPEPTASEPEVEPGPTRPEP